MKRILLTIFFVLAFGISNIYAAKILSGALTGDISGDILQKDNSSLAANGNIAGSWLATMNDDGSISGYANGKFALIDKDNNAFSGSFSVEYDPKTNSLTGTWSLPGLSEKNSINFTIDEFTGKFSGPIEGIIPTKSGGMSFKGIISLDFKGFPISSHGKVNTDLIVEVGWAPTSMDGAPVSCSVTSDNYVSDKNGKVSGEWSVDIAPDKTVTGNANGVFAGTAVLNFKLNDSCLIPGLSSLLSLASTYGYTIDDVTFTFPYYGTWEGTLQGDIANGLFFGGSWTESYSSKTYESYGVGFEDINISTLSDGLSGKDIFGGSIKIDIDLENATTFSIPVTGVIHGGGTVTANIRELAKEQGICDKYEGLISKLSLLKVPVPACIAGNDICNCLPTEVKVNWWVEKADLEGNLSFDQ